MKKKTKYFIEIACFLAISGVSTALSIAIAGTWVPGLAIGALLGNVAILIARFSMDNEPEK